MPIIYTGTGGLFKHLGALISRINSYKAMASTTLPTDLGALVAAFETTWLPPEGVASTYENLKSQVIDWRRILADFCDRGIND